MLIIISRATSHSKYLVDLRVIDSFHYEGMKKIRGKQGHRADGDVNLELPMRLSHVEIKKLYDPLRRKHRDDKVVGLTEGIRRAMEPSTESLDGSLKHRIRQHTNSPHRDYLTRTQRKGSLDDDEQYARSKSEKRPIVLCVVGYFTALKIFFYYLISLNSLLTCGLTVGLTVYWYNRFISVSSTFFLSR